MATDVIMPQMGESIAEGTITRWLVGVGETVERDQPLLEISTDKVDAEIPSPASGTLIKVLFSEGDTVEVDQVIAFIGEAAEASAASAASQSAPVPSPAQAPAPAEAGGESQAESAAEAVGRQAARSGFASPVVKKIAAERGIDVDQVPGSGIHGRVTKRDILQYLEARGEGDDGRTPSPELAPEPPQLAARSAAAPSMSAPSPAPRSPVSTPPAAQRPASPPASSASAQLVKPAASQTSVAASGSEPSRASAQNEEFQFSVPAFRADEAVEVEPMSKIRRLTAAHMLYSQQTSAHVTTVFDVDLTAMVAARQRVKDRFFEKTRTKLTFMPFLFRAVIDGLKTYPKFNAAIDGTDIVYKKDIHLGMAVALDWGLLVPVIHHADQLNLLGLASSANDLADRARSKRLRPEDVQGGTFTVTNPGVYGSLFGTPLINQPQVAILCIGAIEKRPVVITDEDGNDGLGIRWMAYLALSYDHRLIDGADAEQFMVRVKQTLTDSSWDELSAYTG